MPEDRENERIRDVGFAVSAIGFFGLAFVLGRSTSPGHDCCERLVRQDVELLAGAVPRGQWMSQTRHSAPVAQGYFGFPPGCDQSGDPRLVARGAFYPPGLGPVDYGAPDDPVGTRADAVDSVAQNPVSTPRALFYPSGSYPSDYGAPSTNLGSRV
jgi:hypothetical protein